MPASSTSSDIAGGSVATTLKPEISQPLHDNHCREPGVCDFKTFFAEHVGQDVNGVKFAAHRAPPC